MSDRKPLILKFLKSQMSSGNEILTRCNCMKHREVKLEGRESVKNVYQDLKI